MDLTGFEKRAGQLDRTDPLRSFRKKFHIPVLADGTEAIYLLGNSLGLQPKTVSSYVLRELDHWKELGVAAHFHGDEPWIRYQEYLRTPMAALVGGLPHEVVIMNALTVNLHLMMASFFKPEGSRRKIMIESNAFPSDRYAVVSQLHLRNLSEEEDLLVLTPRPGEVCLRTEDVIKMINRHANETALILLGGVNYYTGQVLDMRSIASAARVRGIHTGFDLAHAVGNIPLELHDWDVDFAVWCGYKYLNAGPGAIGACFIHERHARDRSLVRTAGWWGHNPATRFDMPAQFDPIPSADGWQVSNPPVPLLASLRASLEIFEEAGMDRLRAKSLACTELLRDALHSVEGPFRVITPAKPAQHGCQLSLFFDQNAKKTFDDLERSGIRCDYREPKVIRVAPVPLYNSFSEAIAFARALATAFKS